MTGLTGVLEKRCSVGTLASVKVSVERNGPLGSSAENSTGSSDVYKLAVTLFQDWNCSAATPIFKKARPGRRRLISRLSTGAKTLSGKKEN
jgi:hypothetical protein